MKLLFQDYPLDFKEGFHFFFHGMIGCKTVVDFLDGFSPLVIYIGIHFQTLEMIMNF